MHPLFHFLAGFGVHFHDALPHILGAGPVHHDGQRDDLVEDALVDFRIEEEAREMLLEGLDAIELTLRYRGEIEAFIAADRTARPWAYTVEDIPPAD